MIVNFMLSLAQGSLLISNCYVPSLDVISKISGLNSLYISDTKSNIPNPINSKYYFPSDFEKLTLQASSSYFSLFHIKVNSLDSHLSDLHKERLRLYKRWPCSTYILNRVN